jgi:glycogen operon protein
MLSANVSRYESIVVEPGRPYPLGATVETDGGAIHGVNFSLFSGGATSVELLLFDDVNDTAPARTIALDPATHRTFAYWHALVRGIGDGQLYGYRVDGPCIPEKGLRYNRNKLLLDPYARAVAAGENRSREAAMGADDNVDSAYRSVVVDLDGYDWEGDHPLQRPMAESVIYEMHVRGLTRHPSSGVACPGTYAGVIERIPYLQELGVTAVELLPVHQIDDQDVLYHNPLTGEPLSNYWGYSTVGYFAPHAAYACHRKARRVADEFRDMVKALHRAGIEVILDVVFNHTAEYDETGPTLMFRGLDNPAYYMLKGNRRYYQDYTGCGHTVKANHSVVRRLIRECLRYWVQEYHVDGFRFDLASALSRDERGQPISDSPLLWEIETDPVLAGTKLIAEAWDAAGLYQLGAFTGERWAEWNGRFRDDVRRFVRGDRDTARELAWRLTGSFDVFRHKASYVSHQSVNYVTAHDGFTLHDLVSYNKKHNQANGEGNRDGADYNHSRNWGTEGPTDDPEVNRLRNRQMRNLLALLLIARGTPMLLGGDEFARTQGGNNNAYCQDNEVSWFDWRLLDERADLHRFTRGMIALRRSRRTLTADHRLNGSHYEDALHQDVTFHGVRLRQPDWSYHSHTLAVQFHGIEGEEDVYLIANAYGEALEFELPADRDWRRVVDTALDSPEDLVAEDEAPRVSGHRYHATRHSVVILLGRPRRN